MAKKAKVKAPTKKRTIDPSVSPDSLIAKMPSDFGLALVEVCEAIERSYQAAVIAGEAHPHVASSTNF